MTVWVLLFVLFQDSSIILGVGKYALQFLDGQLALSLCVALLFLQFVLLVLITLLCLGLVLSLLGFFTLGVDFLCKLLMMMLDSNDSLIAFRV